MDRHHQSEIQTAVPTTPDHLAAEVSARGFYQMPTNDGVHYGMRVPAGETKMLPECVIDEHPISFLKPDGSKVTLGHDKQGRVNEWRSLSADQTLSVVTFDLTRPGSVVKSVDIVHPDGRITHSTFDPDTHKILKTVSGNEPCSEMSCRPRGPLALSQ